MNDGTSELVDAATMDQLQQALLAEKVLSVEAHKPGSIITHSDGRQYRVDDKGTWRRVDKVK